MGTESDRSNDGNEGREEAFMDIDRMVNEGLGGGYVSASRQNGLIEDTTTDTMSCRESVYDDGSV